MQSIIDICSAPFRKVVLQKLRDSKQDMAALGLAFFHKYDSEFASQLTSHSLTDAYVQGWRHTAAGRV